MPIEDEPVPRLPPLAWAAPSYRVMHRQCLSPPRSPPKALFVDVLNQRRSSVGAALDGELLASILWHASLLRRREGSGRFNLPWESRSAPSAGGLHPIRLLVIPIQDADRIGLYHPERHDLEVLAERDERLTPVNAANVRQLAGATDGVTVQLVGDASKIESCYEHSASLLWRDAGALTTILALVATAFDALAVPLGRVGTDLVRLAGMDAPWMGLGAVHLSSPG
jgi:hypothetical protein